MKNIVYITQRPLKCIIQVVTQQGVALRSSSSLSPLQAVSAVTYILVFCANVWCPELVYGQAKPASQRKARSIFRPSEQRPDGRMSLKETVPAVSDLAAASLFKKEVAEEQRKARKRQIPVRDEDSILEAASRWSSRTSSVVSGELTIAKKNSLTRSAPKVREVITPGQRLVGNDANVFSARVAFSGTNLSVLNSSNYDVDQDVRVLRARVVGNYDRIGGSHFYAHVDAEFRPRLAGNGRFDNQRLNGAYVGWGLVDSRPGSEDTPQMGVAVGRVAVREAGFAQADGLLWRLRLREGVHLGFFGGFTGNPYGFNWRQRIDESFSTNWITGGGFSRLSFDAIQLSLAGVVTNSIVSTDRSTAGLERLYLHADMGWQPHQDVSIFATGYFDMLPGGERIQNGDIAITWSPKRLRVRASVGRWSTVFYGGAIGVGAVVDPTLVIDDNNQAITPFNAAILVASYYNARLQATFRFNRVLEAYAKVNTMIRDSDLSNTALSELDFGELDAGSDIEFASLRVMPAVGIRYRDPKLLDIDAEVMLIEDEQAVADGVLRIGVGRGWSGLYLRADGRMFFGEMDGYDGGVNLSYQLHRSSVMGTFQLNTSLRYYRENGLDLLDLGGPGSLGPQDQPNIINTQETLLGFVGVEWRR